MAVSDPRLVCLDKDGTLVIDEPYNVDPARIRPAPGASEAIRELSDAGFRLAVVSNQPGVALGRFTRQDLDAVQAWLDHFFADAGARLDAFYVCPHATGCDCRKPKPGLVTRALRDHGARADASWMVGDILDDVEAGNRAGCRTALVDNGNETEWVDGPLRQPTIAAPDLAAVSHAIVEMSR